MAKKEVKEIGGVISNFSLNTLLNTEIVAEIERKIGNLVVSHVHIDILDEKGKDIENLLFLYRTNKERKDKLATVLCDKPETYKELLGIIQDL